MDHPQKVLQDATAMYSSRVAIALEERAKHRNAGMFVVMPAEGKGSTHIVADMKVLCLDRAQVLARVRPDHPTACGALAMFDRVEENVVVFGVLFADGGVLATTLQLHDADRDRR